MRNSPIPTSPTHITYRLYGSIPNLGLSNLHSAHRLRIAQLEETYTRDRIASSATARKEYREQLHQSELRCYLAYDNLLDRVSLGPRYLTSHAAKRIVIDSWLYIAKKYDLRLYAISVMSNHVHVLLDNNKAITKPLADIMAEHKRYTAFQLNQLHGTKGRRVWAEKEYSRTVRFGNFERTLWYVLNNPVKAGLTDDPAGWFGNYFSEEMRRNFVEVRALAG